MKCQVTGCPCVLALQGQFLVRNRCERGCTRLMLHGDGWWVRVCRRCALGATAYVPASVRMRSRARRSGAGKQRSCSCVAKTWPYRPMGPRGWMPGISSRAGGPGLTGRVRGKRCGRRAVDVNSPVTAHNRGATAAASGHEGVTGRLTSTARHRIFFKMHPVVFPACKASSISLA
jgi:hypothetical protein